MVTRFIDVHVERVLETYIHKQNLRWYHKVKYLARDGAGYGTFVGQIFIALRKYIHTLVEVVWVNEGTFGVLQPHNPSMTVEKQLFQNSVENRQT